MDVLLAQVLVLVLAVTPMQLIGQRVPAKVIGKRIALFPQCIQLAPSFRDQRVFVFLLVVAHLKSLFKAGFDEVIECPVENCLSVTGFHAGAQILDPALVQHIVTDLAAPANI